MRKIFIAFLVAALTACASSPADEQSAATVEDRKPGAVTPSQEPQAQPVARAPVAGVDLTKPKAPAGPLSALRDPNNILSKRSVFFDLDSFAIKDEAKPLVQAHARYLRDTPAAKMLIQGNTDERGSREYNLALGQRRADSLKKMLVLLGAKDEQIESVSLGEEKPRSQGASDEALAENRRGDMLYAGEY